MITSHVKTVLLAVVLTVGGAACGDDGASEEVATRGGGGGAAPPKKPKEEKPPAKKIANDEWDKVKPYFLGMKNDPNVRPYAQAPLQTIPDPFQHRLVKFVPKPDPLPAEPVPEEGTDGEELGPIVQPPPVEPKGELERYAVRDYALSLIRWGTTLNKAVLTDPNGQSFIVVKDMKLGNNNGRITDITEYAVIVEEDDRDEPIKLSVEPPLLKINAQKIEDNDRLFTSQVAND